ncbi:MAG: UDP-N-acetylmuramate dehydrogenase [Clostridiales bacterium]|nr:UDP-N-acetylmuramate dehydrogenase [Clostridiales bacterium]
MVKEIVRFMYEVLGEENLLLEEPMKNHTTFRVGGPATYYLIPHTAEEVKNLVVLCKQNSIPYTIIGNGSNLLVSDQGYKGAIIQVSDNLNSISIKECIIEVGAGTELSVLAKEAAKESLEGLEFSCGIPGTLGGAVTMNAGAYDGEISQVLRSVTILDEDGIEKDLLLKDLELGYRKSIISKKKYIVLSATLELVKGNKKDILSRMEDFTTRRQEKQPLEFPSAGSTFKRPEGYYAGKLILDAGLCGYSIGGASVSTKHCGFVINQDNATAKDVKDLISHIRKTVYEKFQVELEPEVKTLGDF